MKYIVITAKHHEGLALWDTKVESFKDYTGTKTFSLQQYTPFGASGRDILMELKNACKEAGIHFGCIILFWTGIILLRRYPVILQKCVRWRQEKRIFRI